MNTEQKSIADKIAEGNSADWELFSICEEVLGEDQVKDTSSDDYDSSVELVRPDGSVWMTEEQACKILERTGFAQIYESVGDEGRQWMKDGCCGQCSPRKAAPERSRLRRLESELEASRRECAEHEAVNRLLTATIEHMKANKNFVRREVLEKCVEALKTCDEGREGTGGWDMSFDSDKVKEALKAATAELA